MTKIHVDYDPRRDSYTISVTNKITRRRAAVEITEQTRHDIDLLRVMRAQLLSDIGWDREEEAQ